MLENKRDVKKTASRSCETNGRVINWQAIFLSHAGLRHTFPHEGRHQGDCDALFLASATRKKSGTVLAEVCAFACNPPASVATRSYGPYTVQDFRVYLFTGTNSAAAFLRDLRQYLCHSHLSRRKCVQLFNAGATKTQ